MEQYTFQESPFEDTVELYIAKENNVRSEQTFQMSFQVTDFVPPNSGFAVAELGVDYRGLSRQFARPFPANVQRLPLFINLVADRIPKQTEAFQICSGSEGSPNFTLPSALFQ